LLCARSSYHYAVADTVTHLIADWLANDVVSNQNTNSLPNHLIADCITYIVPNHVPNSFANHVANHIADHVAHCVAYTLTNDTVQCLCPSIRCFGNMGDVRFNCARFDHKHGVKP
jgi:hypothetical protein